MKEFSTGRTIHLKNIGTFANTPIGTRFYNFVRDIATPEYELIDKKYFFRYLDVDCPIGDPNRIIEEIEIERYRLGESGLLSAYCDQWDGEYVIKSTIKNINTGEIFVDEISWHNSCDDGLAEWSSTDENEAFELADWYFKSTYK